MTDVAFSGLTPASDTHHARSVVEAMDGREGVALVIPDGFEAYARVLHALPDGQGWHDVAPDYLRTDGERYPYPFSNDIAATEGDAGAEVVDTIVPLLTEATRTPERCHFGLWSGWGELHPGSHSPVHTDGAAEAGDPGRPDPEEPVYAFVSACAVQPWWGARDMLLFDGPLHRVAAIGTPWPTFDELNRRGPQWWWPEDRRWFVATEIDYPWTYVGGPAGLVDAVIAHPELEAVPVAPDDDW